MARLVVVINSGSSSVKCALFESASAEGSLSADSRPELIWSGKLDWHDDGSAEQTIQERQSAVVKLKLAESSFDHALEQLLKSLPVPVDEIDAVGHRVVHGGEKYIEPTIVDHVVERDIHSFIELAPAHERANLHGIEVASRIFKQARQVAVFDTTFHHTLPEPARLYPGPFEWYSQYGLRRFGFHGINHQYCCRRAAEILARPLTELRIVSCHLGGGASLAAVEGGRCVMTTMGYTPLDGLMMSCRSGSIDPGIILHLLMHQNYSASDLLAVLNKGSGLKGISGLSHDMREIVARMPENERARLAFDMYILSLKSHMGAMLAILGGVDVVVFTGGIGENSAEVRAAACQTLSFAGVSIDQQGNTADGGDRVVSPPEAAVKVMVIRANEELAIAMQTLQLI